MKTSESSASSYRGSRLSVRRVIDAGSHDQPRPNGPFPAPLLCDRPSDGPNPERPGDKARGTDIEQVPVAAAIENFSPMPRIAPPPFGKVGVGSPGPDGPSGERGSADAEGADPEGASSRPGTRG